MSSILTALSTGRRSLSVDAFSTSTNWDSKMGRPTEYVIIRVSRPILIGCRAEAPIMTRRTFLPVAVAAAGISEAQEGSKVTRKGRLKQGVTRGCFGRGKTLDEMAREAARLGAVSFDLIGQADWPTLRKYGLVPSMVPGAGTIPVGSNRKENHPKMLEQFKENIPLAASNGCPNVI